MERTFLALCNNADPKEYGKFLNNYSNNKTISKQDYYDLFLQYSTQHQFKKDTGEIVNWIDENLNPFTGDWTRT